MTLTQYLNIQQIIMGVLLALGGHLLFAHIRKELRHTRIHMAGQITGIAIAVIPIASFIYYFSGLRYAGPQFATALNLSAYAITATLIATAYILLLDHKNDKPIIRTHLMIGLSYPLPMWFGLYFCSETLAKHILIASYTVFCVLIITQITMCTYLYHRTADSNTTLTSPQKIGYKLLKKTVHVSFGLVLVSLFSPSFYSYPLWLGMVFVMSLLAGIAYIYTCFHRTLYIADFADAANECNEAEAPAESEENEKYSAHALNNAVRQTIEDNLQCWINRREFLRPEITLNSVAKATCTNRTYLSKYINFTYHCSFKTWIIRLRINEAKELMLNKTKFSQSQIAMQTGFTSMESFAQTFINFEGMAPLEWRERNCTTCEDSGYSNLHHLPKIR